MNTNIILSFATETAFSTHVHDLILELAEYLAAHGWRGNFHLTGDFARALRRHARHDVIRALARHEIGYHCNHHGGRPFMAGYCETEAWDDAVALWLREELPGISLLRELFDRAPAYYTTEFAKAPAALYGAWLAGIPAAGLVTGQGPADQAAVLPDGGMGAAWYCNSFVPTGRYLLSVDPQHAGFDVNMRRALAGLAELRQGRQGAVRAFMHEYMLVCDPTRPTAGSAYDGTHYEDITFDCLPDAAIRDNIVRMKKALAILADQPGARFISFTEYRERLYYPGHGLSVDMAELDIAARESSVEINAVLLGDKSISPAELAGVLARALRAWHATKIWPQRIVVRGLLGPVVEPAPGVVAGMLSVDDLLAGLPAIDRGLDDTGYLPSNIDVGTLKLTTGQWLRALAWLYRQLRQDHAVPEYIEVPPDGMPVVAADQFFRQSVFTRPIYPAGFTGERICRLCRLQAWSWKPAVPRDEIL